MALAELQRALATLYTDEPSRERFARDPRSFASRFALTESERTQLIDVGETRLHAYADALDRKRANEAARLLPISARALGPAFRRRFFQFARTSRLQAGPQRYLDDAIAFARRPGSDPIEAFEGTLLARSRAGSAFIHVAAFRCNVRATVRSGRVVRGATLALWFASRSEPLLFALPSSVWAALRRDTSPKQR